MFRTDTMRIKEIQKKLKVEVDGVLGPETLTALEVLLEIAPPQAAPTKPATVKASSVSKAVGMKLGKRGIDQLVAFEVTSKSHYQKSLQQPIWPGGDSGVTIGIGYDLGYQEPEAFQLHWQSELTAAQLARLKAVCGLKGKQASNAITALADIKINYDSAARIFCGVSLFDFARLTLKTYPGVENLFPDAQAALVSLIYNRGSSLKNDDRRREMREIVALVAAQDYQGIANRILSMKRLWGSNLPGLLKRRDIEADLVLNSNHDYAPSDVVEI